MRAKPGRRRSWLFVAGADAAARAARKERAAVDGALIEVPIYAAAKRLLENLA